LLQRYSLKAKEVIIIFFPSFIDEKGDKKILVNYKKKLILMPTNLFGERSLMKMLFLFNHIRKKKSIPIKFFLFGLTYYF